MKYYFKCRSLYLSSSGLCLALRESSFYWVILVSLVIFGFFGMGIFPLVLELSVEVTTQIYVILITALYLL
jgi:hypothetical protein